MTSNLKSNLLLLAGIPLVLILGMAIWETGKLYWVFLAVPLIILRLYKRAVLTSRDIIVVPKRDAPDLVDTNHISPLDKQ